MQSQLENIAQIVRGIEKDAAQASSLMLNVMKDSNEQIEQAAAQIAPLILDVTKNLQEGMGSIKHKNTRS